MVGDLALVGTAGGEATCLDEVRQQLRVVDHFVVATELGVFVLNGVKAVRAGGHDLLCADSVERLNVGLSHLLEQVLVTKPSGGVS